LISILSGLEIPETELEFVASRSGGPGGQNVNKVSSRVTLRFDLERTTALSADQLRLIRSKLATRINKNGVLQVTSQVTRSQDLNREDVIARFADLLRAALHQEKKRVKTKASRASKEQRIQEKKNRTRIKQGRGKKGWEE